MIHNIRPTAARPTSDRHVPADLVRTVSAHLPDAALTEPVLDERFARAAWTHISDPGDRLAWDVIEKLGARTALDAVRNHWHPEQLLEALGADEAFTLARVAEGIERWGRRFDTEAIIQALARATHLGASLITPADAEWPSGLRDLGHDEPLALWAHGNIDALRGVNGAITVTGARAATSYGEDVTAALVGGLADRGFTIASGGAYGIEGTAHRAALSARGTTIAVLAGGVDRPYPAGHLDLFQRIARSGAVVSQLPCGAAPTRWRFLTRNRILAAMSGSTLVTEAGARSGSLNLALSAISLGRPLAAVPGPISSPTSAGCHRLIRDHGAALVTSPEDFLASAGRH
ncbi:DNA-processing protein DprA [Clavibacter michiganensis]|uniref:DNA-processing protein DprA n=1 Tax=Clavibacter michiganensis TaxID=28447 RepID=UPI002931071F|nr:DNA-processing protein DprA [Clavibacter michiganensis]